MHVIFHIVPFKTPISAKVFLKWKFQRRKWRFALRPSRWKDVIMISLRSNLRCQTWSKVYESDVVWATRSQPSSHTSWRLSTEAIDFDQWTRRKRGQRWPEEKQTRPGHRQCCIFWKEPTKTPLSWPKHRIVPDEDLMRRRMKRDSDDHFRCQRLQNNMATLARDIWYGKAISGVKHNNRLCFGIVTYSNNLAATFYTVFECVPAFRVLVFASLYV